MSKTPLCTFCCKSTTPRNPQIIATIQGKNDQERDERKGEGGPPAAITNAKMFQLEGRKRAPNLAPLEDALPQARYMFSRVCGLGIPGYATGILPRVLNLPGCAVSRGHSQCRAHGEIACSTSHSCRDALYDSMLRYTTF